jgi:hypothetical protein
LQFSEIAVRFDHGWELGQVEKMVMVRLFPKKKGKPGRKEYTQPVSLTKKLANLEHCKWFKQTRGNKLSFKNTKDDIKPVMLDAVIAAVQLRCDFDRKVFVMDSETTPRTRRRGARRHLPQRPGGPTCILSRNSKITVQPSKFVLILNLGETVCSLADQQHFSTSRQFSPSRVPRPVCSSVPLCSDSTSLVTSVSHCHDTPWDDEPKKRQNMCLNNPANASIGQWAMEGLLGEAQVRFD